MSTITDAIAILQNLAAQERTGEVLVSTTITPDEAVRIAAENYTLLVQIRVREEGQS